jgi:hypothetical protein
MPSTPSSKDRLCRNCGIEIFAHKAKKGLCGQCYPISLRIEQVAKWNVQDPKSLRGFPRAYPRENQDFIERIKSGVIQELRDRLNDLRRWGNPTERELDGTSFECLFNELAMRCKTRSHRPFFGYANIFDHNFNRDQKRMLYSLLSKMLRDIRWHGVNWDQVFLHGRSKA